jgi:Acetyltransferase (GNAT) domain
VAIFGAEEVTRWLTPAMEPVLNENGMQDALDQLAKEEAQTDPPVGHWAVRLHEDDDLLASITLRRMPPFQEDLELAWQFAPNHWRQGYATKAAQAVAGWAFEGSGPNYSLSCGRPTSARRSSRGAWAFSGSERPTSTTACASRCSGFGLQTLKARFARSFSAERCPSAPLAADCHYAPSTHSWSEPSNGHSRVVNRAAIVAIPDHAPLTTSSGYPIVRAWS